jgi:hypothetical protein
MRLIEQQMWAAIQAGNDWSKDNTSVMYLVNLDQSYIYLHGHRIALYDHNSARFIPDLETLATWPTVTTKSRLRALGVDVYTRKGITYVNDKEVI